MAIISVKQSKNIKTTRRTNYVDFWSDHVTHRDEDSGLEGTMLKAIKLRGYQNAITNFVKILTNKEIPVVYAGTDSYTDGTKVVLAGDLCDKKFDVAAGLALHEASHIKHTSWDTLQTLLNQEESEKYKNSDLRAIKGWLNWVEDRRIDNLVFKSSPGYKGYYHSMYDHYFRSKETTLLLTSQDYREPTYRNYEAHIINMMNPAFNANALPGLNEIVKIIDINNIDRLKSTDDALEVAYLIYDKIMENVIKEKDNKKPEQEEEDDQQSTNPINGEEQESETNEEQESETNEEQGEEDDQQEGEDEETDDKVGRTELDEFGKGQGNVPKQLTLTQKDKVARKLRDTRALIAGEVDKKILKNKQAKMVATVTNSGVDIASTVDGAHDCMIYRLDKEAHNVEKMISLSVEIERISNLTDRYEKSNIKLMDEAVRERQEVLNMLPPAYYWSAKFLGNNAQTRINKWITPGVQLGAILGKKLLVRRDNRSLEHNRLRSGKIDAKRIAHAGYGVESIFNQINIESNRNAVIHLTLDASGSMSGSRWNNSIKLAASLIKAVSMVDGLELQISTRDSANFGNTHLPVLTMLYDSKINKPHQGYRVLSITDACSLTPEGICLEALIDKKLLTPSSANVDSYLINVCDGDPYYDNGRGNYYNRQLAIDHTRKQVKRINTELGIKHAGFFMGDELCDSYNRFKQMYGAKQTQALPNADNAMVIAQHINRQLMA